MIGIKKNSIKKKIAETAILKNLKPPSSANISKMLWRIINTVGSGIVPIEMTNAFIGIVSTQFLHKKHQKLLEKKDEISLEELIGKRAALSSTRTKIALHTF